MGFAEKLNNHYDEMLKLRESLGYSVGKNPQMVRAFITFCGNNYPDAGSISREMLDRWLSDKNFRTTATHNYAITKIRGFARYLLSIGESAYVPSEDYSIVPRYVPYVFTDEELSQLFDAIDSFPPHRDSPNREFIVPVLFRMMYCCGMRPSEPPSLLVEDINLSSGEVYIRQSKGSDHRCFNVRQAYILVPSYASHMTARNTFLKERPGSVSARGG